MKFKHLIILGSLVLATNAFADISVTPIRFTNQDSCANIIGNWEGRGTVKAEHGLIVCHYSGKAQVSQTLANFNMLVDMEREDGICPKHEQFNLTGDCNNGLITFKTTDADIHGNLNEDGTSADLSGQATFDVMGSKVFADISDLKMNKV